MLSGDTRTGKARWRIKSETNLENWTPRINCTKSKATFVFLHFTYEPASKLAFRRLLPRLHGSARPLRPLTGRPTRGGFPIRRADRRDAPQRVRGGGERQAGGSSRARPCARSLPPEASNPIDRQARPAFAIRRLHLQPDGKPCGVPCGRYAGSIPPHDPYPCQPWPNTSGP